VKEFDTKLIHNGYIFLFFFQRGKIRIQKANLRTKIKEKKSIFFSEVSEGIHGEDFSDTLYLSSSSHWHFICQVL
jgi:hypothetical protein